MTTIHSLDLGITEDEIFSLKNESIKFDTEEDIKPYLIKLKSKTNLKRIDISGNTISPECSKLLANEFLNFKDTLVDINLQDIYTSRDKFEIPKSLSEFFKILLALPNLKVLNLSDNAFGQDTIEVLEGFISKCTTVEHFIMSNNGLGPISGSKIGKSLYKMAKLRESTKSSKTLKSFWCGRNRLENGSMDALSVGLSANKDLTEIKLYQNGIRPVGISKLIYFGLSKLKNLKLLDLQDNTFTLIGSIALSSNLINWPNLVELNVNDCLLKSKGCKIVLENLLTFAEKSNLQVLKLQYNELDSDSLELLCKILPNLKDLTSLELNGNRFEEDSESVEKINEIFEEKGYGELDELDDLEEPDSDEEGEDEDEDEDEDENEEAHEVIDNRLKELEKELDSLVI